MSVDFEALRGEIEAWVNDSAGQALDALGQEVRAAAPYGAGASERAGVHLVDSYEAIILSSGASFHGQIAFTAEHASYVDEGTDPHQIDGNPFLAFEWEGNLVIVRSVQHPGTDPNPFFTEGITDETWTDHVEQALGTLA